MGRGRGKGKKLSLTDNNGDPASGEDDKILAQKRRGRPQKPLMDGVEEDVEKIEEDDDYDDDEESASSDLNGNKRKRDKEGHKKGNLVKEESPNGSRSNGFRHVGSRRKNKPHRAAEVGVECKKMMIMIDDEENASSALNGNKRKKRHRAIY
ncbi:hypothetical protein L1987_04641 [Smallanthus sonchifolius]|uniref:Uncharacterized protein n=1 Tax=Smallanthus sonchifolius TaxID=185202 RepID=A0ACB9JT94_9ASTR|nr:hypothetical protein L1987_04641 [Smallanthus sonchifolius]